MSKNPSEPVRIVLNRHHWNGQTGHLRATLMTWEWRWRQIAARGAVELDFSPVEFMEPWALAMFAAFGRRARQAGLAVTVRLDPANPCNQYLAAMGLEQVIETGASSPHWDRSQQNTGLHVLNDHASVTRFLASAARLGFAADSSAGDALRYGMSELARNVVQHAQSPIGGVAIAQRFPGQREVQVAVCDCGRGVRTALSANYPEIQSDLEALRVAVLPHASGALPPGPYGSSENAGLGLFFSKEISRRAGGSFWIASHGALLGVQDQGRPGGERVYRQINPWEGTLVVMHFPDELQVEFDEIQSVCRELARQARQDGAEAGLDFVGADSELPESNCEWVRVGDFVEDVEQAGRCQRERIRPAMQRGDFVILDFDGVRFVTQSFAHALLHEVFRVRGSLTKLIFRGCTKSTQESIRLVAAYSKVGYFQQPL